MHALDAIAELVPVNAQVAAAELVIALVATAKLIDTDAQVPVTELLNPSFAIA